MDHMSPNPGWEQAVTAADLEPDERMSAVIPAITPPPDHGSGGQMLPGLGPLVLLIMAIRRAAWHGQTRTAATRSAVPLSPRMLIGLTDRRLIIWTARRRWHIGASLGSIRLDRVAGADAPTVGSGWRSVIFHLSGQPDLIIKVPATAADRLAAELSEPARRTPSS